jgi:hypothetical protein
MAADHGSQGALRLDARCVLEFLRVTVSDDVAGAANHAKAAW